MSLYRKIQSLKAQIIDTERLLEMVLNHPIMSHGLIARIKLLRRELENLPAISFEPKVQLLFSGGAVIGSQGIKSTFVSKTIAPFQEMIKTQFAVIRFGAVGKRGMAKNATNTELYLTALPLGSFGVELSQLETTDLFAAMDVSNAIKQVINLVSDTALNDESFELAIQGTPKRNLANLKKFLHEVSGENSILKIESGELGIEISTEKVKEAYQRVSSTTTEEDEIIIRGIFRGLLLDSGKFEIQDDDGIKYYGFVSEEINEEQLINYNSFLNSNCIIHLQVHKTKFKTGNEKNEYELLEVRSIPINKNIV